MWRIQPFAAQPRSTMQTLSLRSPLFHPTQRSLARGNLLVVASLLLTLRFSGFPELHTNPWLLFTAAGVALGTFDTTRCMRRRWSFYHGGVLLCIYMDLMAAVIVVFALVYPYVYQFTGAR